MKLQDAMNATEEEFRRATAIHPPFNSFHEGLAVIEEEFLELRDEVYTKNPDLQRIQEEATQLGAMCLRLLVDLGRGGKRG